MEQILIEKIKKVEALIERSSNEGERDAALRAKERLLQKQQSEEFEFTIHVEDQWHKKLFLALCYKYGLRPYRYYRQKYTTIMVRVPKNFMNNVLWKEYLEYTELLAGLLGEITDNLISRIHTPEEEMVIKGNLEYK